MATDVAGDQNAHLRTAQARFVRWFSSATSVSQDVALQLWCKVNSILESDKRLAGVQVGFRSAADAERSYDNLQTGLGSHAKNIVGPVLSAIVVGGIVGLVAPAILAAVAALVVFVVLLHKQGGTLDGLSDWIGEKLAVLNPFSS